MKLAIQWHYQGPICIWLRNADVNIDIDSVLWCFKHKFDFVVHHKIATILWYNKIKLVMPQSRFWNIVISQKSGYFDITKSNLWILKIYHKYLKFRTIFWDIKIRFCDIRQNRNEFALSQFDIADRPDSSPIRVCTVCPGLSVQRLGTIRYLSDCVCLSKDVCLSFCL